MPSIKQYINEDPTEQNKAQRFRPNKQMIRLQENHFEVYERGTTFIQSSDYLGHDVHGILSQQLCSTLSENRNVPVREPYVFDRPTLQTLAELSYQDKIQDLQSVHDNKSREFNTFGENKKLLEQRKHENQYRNELKDQKTSTYKKHQPREVRKLMNIEEELEQKKKKHINKKKN